jgi:hypothetical protein
MEVALGNFLEFEAVVGVEYGANSKSSKSNNAGFHLFLSIHHWL